MELNSYEAMNNSYLSIRYPLIKIRHYIGRWKIGKEQPKKEQIEEKCEKTQTSSLISHLHRIVCQSPYDLSRWAKVIVCADQVIHTKFYLSLIIGRESPDMRPFISPNLL